MNKLYRQASPLGQAVYANKPFPAGTPLLNFGGPILQSKDLPPLNKPEDDRYLQIGPDRYLGPSGDFDDYINHSCHPNAGVVIRGDQVTLVAINDISPHEEITWDYSTTMDEENWEMDCACGTADCRHRIRDFKYLPLALQQKYLALGIVPAYIVQKYWPGHYTSSQRNPD